MAEPFRAQDHPDRLNLGCGFDVREGYLNVDIHDFHHPDLVADVTKLDMLPPGYYQEILAQDVLEHLPRTSTVDVLCGWSRLLRPAGTLHIRVPSVIDLAELMKAPDRQSIDQQELLVQCLFGTQAYTEDTHYTTFTEPLLRHYLDQAELDVEGWSLRDGWLFEVDAVRRGPSPGGDSPGSGRLSHLVARLRRG